MSRVALIPTLLLLSACGDCEGADLAPVVGDAFRVDEDVLFLGTVNLADPMMATDAGVALTPSCSQPPTRGDAWVSRLRPNRTEVWSVTLGGTGFNALEGASTTRDGRIWLAGCTTNADLDAWVVTVSTDGGDVISQRALSGAGAQSLSTVVELADGDVAAAGLSSIDVMGEPSNALLLARFDPDGATRWQRVIGAGEVTPIRLVARPDNGLMVIGARIVAADEPGSAEPSSAWVAAVSPDGDLEWERVFSTGFGDRPEHAIWSADGLVVVGSTNVPIMEPAPPEGDDIAFLTRDVLVFSIAAGGQLRYHAVVEAALDDRGLRVAELSSGGYVVAGTTNSFGGRAPGQEDLWLLKFSATGTLETQRYVGGLEADVPLSMRADADGFVVHGTTGNQPTLWSFDEDLALIEGCGQIADSTATVVPIALSDADIDSAIEPGMLETIATVAGTLIPDPIAAETCRE